MEGSDGLTFVAAGGVRHTKASTVLRRKLNSDIASELQQIPLHMDECPKFRTKTLLYNVASE
jgi:hypothetical protein